MNLFTTSYYKINEIKYLIPTAIRVFILKNIIISFFGSFIFKYLIWKTIKTASRQVKHQLDSSIEINNFKHYKNHPGKYMIKYIELPGELEDIINKILSG